MTNSASNLQNQPTQFAFQSATISRVAVVRAVGDLLITILFAYMALQTGAWQFNALTVMASALVIADLIGFHLSRCGRPQLAAWLIIGMLFPAILITSALLAEFGLVLSIIVVVLTSMVAAQMLPPKQLIWAILTGILVGIGVVLIDLFGPVDRLIVPKTVQIVVPVVAGGQVLIFAGFRARQFTDSTLRTKLIMTFLIVALIPLATLAFVNNREIRQVLTDDANQALFGAASQTAASLDTFVQTSLDAVRTESLAPVLRRYFNLPAQQRPGSLEEAEVAATLRSFSLKDQIYINSYALLDQDGIIVVETSGEGLGQSVADQDYFLVPFETGLPYVSPVKFPGSDQPAALYFAAPVRNATGSTVGVLRVRYNASILQEFIVQGTRLAKPQVFGVLFDENSLHLAHGTYPETIYKLVAPLDEDRVAELQLAERLPDLPIAALSLDLPDLHQNLANADTQPFFTARDVATGDLLNQVAVTSMKRRPWLVAFFEPQEVFLAPAEAQTRGVLLLAVLVAVVVAAAAIGMGQILSRPIMHLNEVAQRVAVGDLDVQAPIESRDEIGQLATTFNSMTGQLRDLIGSLEEQVRERTADLALSMEVGQQASAIRDLAELLSTITELIREQFDLYYTQIYLVDDLHENLILKSGTGTVGKELLARGHSLLLKSNSIVGRVASEGKPIAVSNTATSTIHKPNPLLPQTRSELAAPLIVEGRVIGVLDMQSSQVGTFTEENLTVFEAMATQLAISIDSAQQWAAAQEAQNRSQRVIRELVREGWSEQLAPHRGGLGFAYDLSSVTAIEPNTEDTDGQDGSISAPVAIQSQPVGYLSVKKPTDQTWTEDEQNFLEIVAQQLAHKAENLRLFEATQRRVNREQITRQIAERIQASRDIESALKTAMEELTKALGTSRAVIDLRIDPERRSVENGHDQP